MFFRLVFLFIGFLISCKTNTIDSSKKFFFDRKTLKDAKYYFDISTESNTVLEVSGNEVENLTESEIGLIYEMFEDSLKQQSIRITYDKFKSRIKDKSGERFYEARKSTAVFDPLEKVLGGLIGNSIIIKLNDKREITAIVGYAEMIDKIMSEITLDNEVAKRNLRDRLSEMLGDKMIRNHLQENFAMLPDSARAIGESWTRHQESHSGVQLNSTTTYTLESVENNLAEITSQSTIEAGKLTAQSSSMQASSELKGKIEGEYKVDINTGMPANGSSDMSLKGSVKSMGSNIPVEIRVVKKYTIKKMD